MADQTEKPKSPIPSNPEMELNAIKAMTGALQPLDNEGRVRVMNFVTHYFQIGGWYRPQ